MKAGAYRVGIIGCGRVGWLLDMDPLIPNKPVTHMGAYVGVGSTHVVTAADVRADRLHAFSRQFGVESVYLDYREMLARERLDIVSICAHAADRYRMVSDAVKAGVRGIWCEKAFATSLSEAEAMTRVCEENGVTLVVNHTRRFSAEYQRAKTLLAEGAIGKPLSVVCHFSGSIVHTGTHAYDVLRYLLGEAVWVEGNLETAGEGSHSMKQPPGTTVLRDTGGHGLIAFENGVYASVHGDSRGYFIFEFDIMGTKGRLRIGNWLFELYQAEQSARESGLWELRKRKAGRRRAASPAVPALLHLLGCMEGRTNNMSGPRDGMAALEIALALQRSYANGGARVALPLQDSALRVMSR